MGEEQILTFDFPEQEPQTTADSLKQVLDRMGEDNFVIQIPFGTVRPDREETANE